MMLVIIFIWAAPEGINATKPQDGCPGDAGHHVLLNMLVMFAGAEADAGMTVEREFFQRKDGFSLFADQQLDQQSSPLKARGKANILTTER